MSSLHLNHQATDVYSTDGGKDKSEWTAKHLVAANITYLCVISGFCHEVDEICTLLGYYTAHCGNSLLTVCPLVRNYHTMQRNIPEECKSHYLLNNISLPIKQQTRNVYKGSGGKYLLEYGHTSIKNIWVLTVLHH
jgi:hypothetical protein